MPPMEEEEEEQQASPTPQPKKRGRPRKDKTKEEREREETTPAERMREKKQAHHASTVDDKYVQWKSLVPVLYDWLANHNLVWPSLSCRWGPQLEQGKFKNRQRLYLSEQLTSIFDPQSLPNFNLLGLDGPNNGTPKIPNHSSCSFAGNSTDGSVPNTLVIAICDVVKSRVAAAEHVAEFNEEARSPFVKKSKTIIHPGEVNRIRELPQNNNIVATHTDSPEVLIWDVEDQSNRHAVLGAAESRPDLVLTGHQENAEFALAMCHTEPLVLSGGKDKSVVLWSIQDHVLPTRPAGSTKSIIKSADSIGPRGIFQGHEDTVEDVQFCPSSAQEFCSVGDDSCLILWDARVGLSPIVKVEKAHNADLHCVDWNPHDSNLILTGSADQSVRLFDRRNLISNGVGSPIHKFEGHKAAVLCVQWSPDRSSVFGSSAEDSLLNVWDYEKVGETRESAGRAPHPPPGLFFQHAGHRDKVVDFHWNAADPWTIVSVSDDCDTSGGGGTLQIWRMSDLIYRPEEEVVAELEKFKSHVIECTSKS